MDGGTVELTEDAIIRLGGWHARYARVVLIEHDDRHAVVLVNGNGDDSELEAEYWHRDDDDDARWRPGSSSVTVRSRLCGPRAGTRAISSPRSAGRSRVPRSASHSPGRVYLRQANSFGAWGFVHTRRGVPGADLPAVRAVRPSQA